MNDIVIKWQDVNGKWQDFPLSDIQWMCVSHAVALFSRSIPVVIKEANRYIVNTDKLFESYKKKSPDVMMLSDVDPARYDKKLSECGFIS